MNSVLLSDLKRCDELFKHVADLGIDFFQNLDQRTTTASPKNIKLDTEVNSDGLGTKEAIIQFYQKFESILVASGGPRYWGLVTGGSTPASIAGDWLAGVFDQNVLKKDGQGDISALIEIETINLLRSLFQLPTDFLGGFVTGSTIANFTSLAVARQWYGKQIGVDFARDGLSGKLNILSATPHSSTIKSLAMLGIGSKNFTQIKMQKNNREAMDMADLQQHIEKLNGEPFILISSAGTVNTVDYDDFEAIAKLRKKYSFWWHVDAAFGAFAVCSPEYKHLLSGWNQSDSITIDCHKWLNVPYESAVYFIKESHKFLQVETFQNSNAPYIGDPIESFSYLNFLPQNSRRLKALPAWFTLKAYGRNGYQEIVENCIRLAKKLGEWIDQNSAFQLLAPVRLNTVCFSLVDNSQSIEFLQRLNANGIVYMTPTIYNGKNGIRAALVNWRTTEKDIQIAIAEIEKTLDSLHG